MDRPPTHPGDILRSKIALGQYRSITQFAKFIDVPRKALADILKRRSGISAGIALKLEMAHIGKAEYWLNLSMEYNLWKARLREQAQNGNGEAKLMLSRYGHDRKLYRSPR